MVSLGKTPDYLIYMYRFVLLIILDDPHALACSTLSKVIELERSRVSVL